MKFKEAVTYDDMLLVPQYSDITSRSEVDISSNLDKERKLTLPILASPMDTVSGVDMAVAMTQAGGMAVRHGYNTIDGQLALVQKVQEGNHRVGY